MSFSVKFTGKSRQELVDQIDASKEVGFLNRAKIAAKHLAMYASEPGEGNVLVLNANGHIHEEMVDAEGTITQAAHCTGNFGVEIQQA